jgi:hypothetical protein
MQETLDQITATLGRLQVPGLPSQMPGSIFQPHQIYHITSQISPTRNSHAQAMLRPWPSLRLCPYQYQVLVSLDHQHQRLN